LKLTVAPDGIPEADRVMELLKPPPTAVVIVDPAWLPCAIVSDAGAAEMVKFGWPPMVTVSVTVVVCWMPPPVPATVMG
jgi:hypothetical protein